ncbi:hypothetical protein APHMUC_0190 [Anaplasma phagocytophilum str. ApMUC09]|uniref:Uncharacterized protein n=1 Tax=Anaplasma phagocytophilum str. ApMUC09 TaxID=1359152 RepID=A0A0F3N8N8_ANAPH|nr:hypothetical protein APHMUC_0190 [Anaplasma phagocytophilum str. ApMUC09]
MLQLSAKSKPIAHCYILFRNTSRNLMNIPLAIPTHLTLLLLKKINIKDLISLKIY